MTERDDRNERRHDRRHGEPPSSRRGGGHGGGGGGGPGGGTPSSSTVSGVVLQADGTPAAGSSVALVRKRLRHETSLGTATSGADGSYSISYTPPHDGASIDLVSRVLKTDGSTQAESPIVFDAGPTETINLSLAGTYRAPSAWTALSARLQPELDGVAVVDLVQSAQQQDISFLANALAHDPKDVADLVIASKLQPKTNVTPLVFYSLFRASIPSTLAASLDSLDTLVIDDAFLTTVLGDVLQQPSERWDSTARAAVAANVVPATLLDTLVAELAKLLALRVQYVGSGAYVRGKTPLTTVLSTSGAPQDLQTKFLNAYTQLQGNVSAVWKQLAADPTVTKPALTTLRFALNTAELVSGNLPLLQHWITARTAGQIKNVRDLAKLDASDWIALFGQVDPGATSITPIVPTETAQQKIERFSTTLATRFEMRMPTQALQGRMAKDLAAPVASRADVLAFFGNSPSFDLANTHIDRFVKDNATTAFAGVGNPAQAVTDLKRMQRVFKLVANYPVVKSLLTNKVDSAQAIYFMGRQTFLQGYGGATSLGQNQAIEVYHRSEAAYANALALFAKWNRGFTFGSPSSVASQSNPQNDPVAQLAGFPNLQSLFGSLDYCACEDCRSVLSPAAYLVDLLQFLAGRASKTAGVSARDVFLKRRPDVADLQLSCDNTNITLPYIDLVCETLEDAVAPSATPPAQRQSSGSPDDLRATPAFEDANAYAKLLDPTNVFPLSMPFNLWVEECRSFLGALGQKRADVMTLYQAAAGGGTPDNTTIAAESLSISPSERTILNGPGAVPPWDFWGLAQTSNDVINPTYSDDPTKDIQGTWLQVLAHVPVFMQRTALDFPGLLQLLDVRYVNPGTPPQVTTSDGSNPDHPSFASCDTGTMQLVGLDQNWLDRANRFLRLWNKTGRPMWELDKIVLSPGVGAGQIGDAALVKLAAFTAIQSRVGTPADELLAFWANLDIPPAYVNHLGDSDVAVPSAYERNFRNPALSGVGAVFPADPSTLSGTLSDPTVVTAIGAVLNLTADDVAAIVAAASLANALTLPNLSVVFRYARLASALSVTIPDLVLWIALTATDPFANPPQTQVFLSRFDVLNATSLAAADVDYLLRHGSTSLSGLVVPDDTIALNLGALRTGLQKLADRVSLAGTVDRDRVKSLLTTIPEFKDPARVATALQIIDGSFSGGQAQQDAFLDQHFSAFMDSTAAKTRLDQPVGPPPDTDNRFSFVLAAIAHYLAASFVTQTVAGQLALQPQTVAVLLEQGTLSGSTTSLGDVLDDPRLLQKNATGDYSFDLTRANFPDAYSAYTLLAKSAQIVATTKVTSKEVSWLMANAGALGWASPTGFPTTPAGVPVSYDTFARLLLGTTLQHTMRAGTVTFFDHVLAVTATGATVGVALASVAALLGWDVPSVTSLANAFAIASPPQFADVNVVDRLRRAVATANNLGVGATLALGLANPNPAASDAAATRQILKSKYDANTWRQILIPIEDALREKKRDALVSYLLAHPDPGTGRRWQTADDLYGWFLIDTQMEACLLTTRIIVATAAIQQFVQRCFLQVEPQIVVSTDITADPNADEEWLQWNWMEYYRVWQANREVFLWPENYLVPQLRPDQSPFFKDFSRELLQSQLTSDTAEEAFRHYLEKLADVQRLVVAAHYHEVDGSHDTLHVVARTRATSPTYYYRQRVDKSYWTAWEKVDLDISGEHLVLVLWDRRLHLVWPMLTQQAQPVSDQTITVPTGSAAATTPNYYWDIQLAISEKKSDKWTAKRVFEPKLVATNFTPKGALSFKASVIADDELIVDVFQVNGAYAGHFGEFAINAATGEVNVFSSFNHLDPKTFGDGADAIGPLGARGKGSIPCPQGLQFDDERFDTNITYAVPLDVLANWPPTNVEILGTITKPALAISQQDLYFDSLSPFFIEDTQRSFFVEPTFFAPGSYGGPVVPKTSYGRDWVTRFALSAFYHPYVTTMIRELNRVGVSALLARNLQLNPDNLRGTGTFDFGATYQPQSPIVQYPQENLDFSVSGAYSLYNWELFFHAPFLIATSLETNRQFQDAMTWLNYIFDPTDGTNDQTPRRYWRTQPFYLTTADDYKQQEINSLLQSVATGDPGLAALVEQWRDDPFDPWGIAKHRTVALQRAVVMKFIDNLIAWGDQQFAAYTMEMVAEATQLYVLASQLLGPRPQVVRLPKSDASKSYNELLALGIDAFGNAIVDVENLLPAYTESPVTRPFRFPIPIPKLPRMNTLYFCVPPNQQLLSYWDTVADRLFKIRHCQNIEGIVQLLPLYAPPINPMLLVQAAAAGLDLSSVIADENAPLPAYRFTTMLAKAMALCGEVQSLGAALLSALEKKDAEKLAALRAGQEVALLTKLRDVKSNQVEAAKADRLVLDKTQAIAQARLDHYNNLINNGLNANENAALDILYTVAIVEGVASLVFALAAIGAWVPDFTVGAAGLGGSPTALAALGGNLLVRSGHMAAEALRQGISAANTTAQVTNTLASYSRRGEDWQLQKDLATDELAQISQQQAAADIRTAVAKADLAAHDLQTTNSQAVADFLQNKFTNADLYDWMASQIATVYFQAYQLAYDLGKRAEQAFNYELGLGQSFVSFGYWDSLHKGLLAGESLMFDLRRMEASYLDLDKREYEITRHVSLALLDPTALETLRETGVCTFSVPEAFFDDDYPGHYFRRLKTAGVTVPAVIGPFTNVNATLTLASSSVRTSTDVSAGYKRKPSPTPDSRFSDFVGAIQAIATSTAQNDAGLFEVNFHDERYLPFERQGAISNWQLELLQETNQFDVSTITDVILHLRYTARDGGDGLKTGALTEVVRASPRKGAVFVSVKQQFSDAFYRFLHPTGTGQTLSFDLGEELFPFIARGKTIKATQIDVFMRLRDPQTTTSYAAGTALKVTVGPDPSPPGTAVTLTSDPTMNNVPHATPPVKGAFAVPAPWHIAAQETDIAPTTLDQQVTTGATTHDRINPDLVDDIILLIQFQAT
jgi:hypothetical protein